MTRAVRPSAISLFTGAGGMDFGLEAAGFETQVCVDSDSEVCATLVHNRKWVVINRELGAVSPERLLFHAGALPGEIDLVVGGPPCQPFSKSGYWARGDSKRLEDPRAQTLVDYLSVVEGTLPKAILFENVRGFAYKGKSEALEFLLLGLDGINQRHGTRYNATYAVLQAADHGVPQLRERFFLVASRAGEGFTFPSGGGEVSTAWDAIWDLPHDARDDLRVKGRWADLLPSIPEGWNYQWHTERGGGLPLFGWRRHFWNFLLKLSKEKPSWTVQAQPGPAVGPFHWDNRRMARHELARLQTFPDSVEILGSLSVAQRQLGNAVPSLLAELLGRAIRRQFFGETVGSRPKLLPSRAESAPGAPSVGDVPAAYLHLVGSHSAHPGTGRGFAAERRPSAQPAILA
ncbi:MAG: DNA cytosine methyltransferase [Dehalococcoidia bacterium]